MSTGRLPIPHQWISGTRAGPLVRWVNPGDWIAVQLFHSDGKARLSKREADGNVTQLVTGTNSVSLTNNSWYTGRVVVGDDTGNSALQRLRFWVDTDGDGDFADETTLLDTTTIDDVWSAGHVGLFRGSVSNAQDFDDFKAGIDANADLDIADAGDEVVVDDDFATNVVSPAYDNNGNLTDDGVFKRVHDAWNRTRKITNRIKSPPSTIGEYEYDGSHRRIQKTLTNSGVENTTNDGGNVAHDYYYDRGRKPIEERNGSNQVLRVYAWLNDELVWMESNGDPSTGNDANPDSTISGESGETPADARYFVHRERGSLTTAVSEYVSGGGAANGRIVERYVRGLHGGTMIQIGDRGASELGSSSVSSIVGNVFSGNRGEGPGPHHICVCLPGNLGSCPCQDDTLPKSLDCIEGQMRDFLDCIRCYSPCPPGAHWEVRNGYCVCVEDPKGECREESAPGGGFREFSTRNACLAMRCPAGFSAFCDTVIEPGQPPISNHFGSCKRCAGECPEGRRCRKITKEWIVPNGPAAGQKFIINTCSCNPPAQTPGTNPGGVAGHW